MDMEKIVKMVNPVLNIFFPPYCIACQKDLDSDDQFEAVCDGCFFKIRESSHQFRVVKPLERVIFYGSYADPTLRILIDYFKYRGAKGLAIPLGELACRAAEEAGIERLFYGEKPIITFVPLHPLKERLRGYNQSALLASRIASHFSLPFLPLAGRKFLTPAQASLKSPEERKENIKHVFSLLVRQVPSKIILVDDVWRSGATIISLARLLRRAGAKTIWVSVAAGAS